MWALIAFFLNYIPNIGSIIASIPAIIIALMRVSENKLLSNPAIPGNKYCYG